MENLIEHIPDSFIKRFHQDLNSIVTVVRRIDEEYNQAQMEFIHDFVHFKKMIAEWNQKYPFLNAGFTESGMQIKLTFYFNSSSLKDLFIESASKIPHILQVNGMPVGVDNIGEKEIAHVDEGTTNHLEIVYLNNNDVKDSLSFKLNKHIKKIELIFSYKEILDINSAEFKISLFYAHKKYNPAINVQQFSKYMCFDTGKISSEGAGEGWDLRRKFY